MGDGKVDAVAARRVGTGGGKVDAVAVRRVGIGDGRADAVATRKVGIGDGKVDAVNRKVGTSGGKIDAITLRKLREIRGLSRKEAAVLLGLNFKSIEKFENGRSNLKQSRIEQALRAYGFTHEDFLLCREGKSEQIQKKFCHKKETSIDKKRGRRFRTKIITKEARVLKVLRSMKKLSQYKASAICGYHKGAIGHIETGRVGLPQARIAHIVAAYGFTMEDFERHMRAEVLVTEVQDECISIIRTLGEEKLKAVHTLLLSFKP